MGGDKNYSGELRKMFELQKFGMKFGLGGIRGILEKLGQPHLGRKFIHLAGTNGKGSVGIMLHQALTEAGYKVGFYTSPHLVTFRERIRVGGEMIGEEDVLRLSDRVWGVIDPNSPPTFFEFVTAMAFLYFREKEVDLAIIEAGLGGRLDSTNVIVPLCSAVTNISLEHTEHLGDTVEKIAAEKAGIIKSGVPLVCGRLGAGAGEVIFRAAEQKKSPVYLLGRDFEVRTRSQDQFGRPTVDFEMGGRRMENLAVSLAGRHQADNAALALAILDLLVGPAFSVSEEQIRSGLVRAVWPGRAELFPAGSWPPAAAGARAPLMLDGAHNPAGAQALAGLLDSLSRDRLHLVVGVMADKDIGGVLGPLIERADRLYLSRPLFSRAASPGLLWDKIAAALGPPKVLTTLYPGLPEALTAAAAEAGEGDLVLLSGSLFTVGEGRAWLMGLGDVESN
ncbi:MAG: bifunctional folylpolyglutamate synthase/dihydrofolate synthase [Candidatus Adiutrix sp.]|nr:bifunctional folylpolyglutamate synthase/dihydrofolate synthase [Candidatus Adiutrix sp.]